MGIVAEPEAVRKPRQQRRLEVKSMGKKKRPIREEIGRPQCACAHCKKTFVNYRSVRLSDRMLRLDSQSL